jgi:2',5'-phosphodiesterase
MSFNVLVKLELMNNIKVALNVDACPPTIVSVKTFEDFTSLVFHDIPLVLEVESLYATSVTVDWYVGDELVCSNSVSYTPRIADVGKHVSVLIAPIRNDNDGRGYEQAYRFQNSVEALPENKILKLRQGSIWTDSNRRIKSSVGQLQKSPLRVMTYNILADQNAYARSSQGKQVSFYPYVDVSILDRKRRMPLILHEILSYQADVICLQEVDELIWRRLFRPVLHHAGYQGYFSMKEASGMAEGCAMLWSLHRFEYISTDEMKCYRLSELVLDLSKCDDKQWKSAASIATVFQRRPDLKDVVENKLGHILQMVSLPLRRNSQSNAIKPPYIPDRLLIANTHLFYHPQGAHIRLMQMYAICRQYERYQCKESAYSYPMILCGDMNSSLRRAAGYLLVNRRVLPSHTQLREHYNTFQWRDRNGLNEGGERQEMRIEHTELDGTNIDWEDFPKIELPHHFPSFLPGYPEEPEFTHYLDSFAGSLDHIFVFGLFPVHSAPMPSVADVTEHVAMPSVNLPSDHVSLVADFLLTDGDT